MAIDHTYGVSAGPSALTLFNVQSYKYAFSPALFVYLYRSQPPPPPFPTTPTTALRGDSSRPKKISPVDFYQTLGGVCQSRQTSGQTLRAGLRNFPYRRLRRTRTWAGGGREPTTPPPRPPPPKGSTGNPSDLELSCCRAGLALTSIPSTTFVRPENVGGHVATRKFEYLAWPTGSLAPSRSSWNPRYGLYPPRLICS